VVTGNCKEMCYEGVHWIGVAHDRIWKWVLQICYNPGEKTIMYFRMTQMELSTNYCMFWHEGTNFSRVLVEVSFQGHLILISTFTCTGICETE
jgi:hypothetical protein